MNFFRLVWTFSLSMAALSVLVMLGLFVRRLIIQSRLAKRDAARARMQDAIYRHLDDPHAGALTDLASRENQRIFLGLVTEMMRGVTGPLRDKLLALLEATIDQKHLVRALRTAAPEDRAKFAARLFWSTSPEIHAALREALGDPDPNVILAAANSLIQSGQPISLIDLVPKLQARDMLGHRAVRDLFRKLAPQNAAALLVLMQDLNPAVVVLAIDALSRTPGNLAIFHLARIAHAHSEVDARAAAVRTLGLIGQRAAASVILAALSDPAWEVKTQAAVAVGRMRLGEAVPLLVNLLQEANWWVRLRAAQALAKLGREGEEVLSRIGGESELASIAAFALAERHSG